MEPLGQYGISNKSGRRWPAIMLVVVTALAYAAVARPPAPESGPSVEQDIRMPVASPPLEPSRPDLFAEPRISDDIETPQN